MVVNVLVFDEELPLLQARVRQIAAAGVDAVIVQALGAVALMRALAPGLPVHGSTQMTITSPEVGGRGWEWVGGSGCVGGRAAQDAGLCAWL